MKKQPEQILDNITELEPPKHLKMAVFARLEREKQKQIMRRKMALLGGFFVAGAGLLVAGAFFIKEIMVSDFWSIFSLSFTDAGTLLAYWQEFALSLLETFPAESFAYLLAPVFVLLVLAKEYGERQQAMKL
jgi:hypothetical protein